ncbi:MAG: hypothetical protein ACHQ4H_16400 [Ktedonobacterales bacterium]
MSASVAVVLVMPIFFLLVVLWLSVLGSVLSRLAWQRTVELKLARIERQLDRVVKHLGINGADPPPDLVGVRDLLRAGQKINAIKLYREQRHVGLKEAKDAVDSLEREL